MIQKRDDRPRMRGQRDFLNGLARLHLLKSADEQRATWRQSMASLARAVADQQAVPLEGLPPGALLASVRSAFAVNLIGDLDWLSPPAAATALFELASALPVSHERRELGRRVLEWLRQGDAATFVSLATLLAQSSPRALSGPTIRARVALSLDLPLGAGAQADALALALISRRDLEREWLTQPSMGSLPSRRLAARLLERAAREAARLASAGDDTGVRIFGTSSVRQAWNRLLADRESLVWRHVAVARGLLSVAVPSYGSELERHLAPSLTPTEWRRAAASLSGAIAIRPESALRQGRSLLDGPLLKFDRGVASAMVFGLPRAAEVEPEAAEELLETLIRVGSVAAAESLVDLRRERIGGDFGIWASKLARNHLLEAARTVRGTDDGKTALVEALEAELRAETEHSEPTLRDHLGRALDAFAESGAQAAFRKAHVALESAQATMSFLEESGGDDSYSRRWSFRALRELDTGLLETATLGDLLTLGARPECPEQATAPLNDLFGRLTRWMIEREGEPLGHGGEIPHLSVRLRALRTYLHLVDADGVFGDDQAGSLRARRILTTRVLLRRVREDAPSPLRRTVCAAAARACDALVREETCELSDIVIAGGCYFRGEAELRTLAEASMVPEIETVARAYLALTKTLGDAPPGRKGDRACIQSLLGLAHELPLGSSRRVEALRSALLGLAASLEHVVGAGSLAELTDESEANALARLEHSVGDLALLVAGSKRRLELEELTENPQSAAAIRLIDYGVERKSRGADEPLIEAVETAVDLMHDELPPAIAEITGRGLGHIPALPLEGPRRPAYERRVSTYSYQMPLPPWLPPSRTIGGFYVVRSLGAGAAASVFVVRRVEERNDPAAEQMALKVPEYDGSAALTLSEDQFLQLFREEAGALLALPQHPNLVRFITFDAGARPKPILVMELVEGPTLERVIAMGDLTMDRAFRLLDGVAAGLEVMHQVGVGHLDLKPSNVILRSSSETQGVHETPMLVDLGLAGRQLRPGCGTPNYASPEIWGLTPMNHTPLPVPADVYAFGCMIYEVLTAKTLFDGTAVGELQKAHILHDGDPEPLMELADDPAKTALVTLVGSMLRRDPRDRIGMTEVRAGLASLAGKLSPYTWPLSLEGDGP